MSYKEIRNEKQDVSGINRLLDEAQKLSNCKNDAALAHLLHFAPPVLSKLRHGKLPMGPVHILRLHELCGMTVAHIRAELRVKK